MAQRTEDGMSARWSESDLTDYEARHGRKASQKPAALATLKPARIVQPKHDYKAEFVQQCSLVGIELQPEFKIFENRKFRADWRVLPDTKILIEFEGGLFHSGKRGHHSIRGIHKDILKYNLCALAGWMVIRITPKHVESGQALQWVEQAVQRYRKEK